MSIETRTSRLVKKTGVKKSRWTVPLRSDTMVLAIQMTVPAMVVDSFASFNGDSAAIGTALPATRMTLPLTRTTLPAT
jgi:hypothetical protein